MTLGIEPDTAISYSNGTLTLMKLSRMYQPRNPLFWLMVALNLLSIVLGWITHTHLPSVFVSLVIVVFAIGNAMLGAYLMWRLVNS